MASVTEPVFVSPTEQIDLSSPRRGRPPKNPTGGTKTRAPGKVEIAAMLGMANFTVTLAGMPEVLALTPPEIDNLAGSLAELAKHYPEAFKYVAVGPKLTAWANFGFTVYAIAAVRISYLRSIRTQTPPGGARSSNGSNGNGKNDSSGSVPVPDAVGSSAGFQMGTEMESISSEPEPIGGSIPFGAEAHIPA